jgi:hypothetical protein
LNRFRLSPLKLVVVLVLADHAVGENQRGKNGEDKENDYNKKRDPVRQMHIDGF